MNLRIKEVKGKYYVQKGLVVYITIKGPFPTKGDAQSWINLEYLDV